MNEERRKEIESHMERAEESIMAAKELINGEHFDFAASRAYYGAFYAATALLLNEDLQFRKHSGVLAAIHQGFVKTGKLDKQFGKDLNWLFELRSVGDYGVIIHVGKDEAEESVKCVKAFLSAVRNLL